MLKQWEKTERPSDRYLYPLYPDLLQSVRDPEPSDAQPDLKIIKTGPFSKGDPGNDHQMPEESRL